MKRSAPLHSRAVFQALFVTFLWSTSWVLIIIGLIQIALLAWLFLGENLTSQEWIGVILAGLGVLLVQLRPTNSDLEQTG